METGGRVQIRSTVWFLNVLLWVMAVTAQEFSTDVCDLIVENLQSERSNPQLAKEIEKHIFNAYLPRLRYDAGNYTRINNIDRWVTCVTTCCDELQCDVALFSKQKCFHITCVKEPANACEPVLSDNPKHNSTVMVVMRERGVADRDQDTPGPEDHSSSHSSSSSSSSKAKSNPSSSSSSSSSPNDSTAPPPHPLELDNGGDSSSNDDDNKGDNHTSGNNKNNKGDNTSSSSHPEKDKKGHNHSASASTAKKKLAGDSCAYGLYECIDHASCVKKNTRSRHGHCECGEGFAPDEQGVCQPELSEEEVEYPEDSSNDKMAISTTPRPTKPPVSKLTVSAGKNKTIQLPLDTVSLTAIVLPEPGPGEKYTYEWSPEQIPDNAQTAIMDGKNTDTLKLSKLIAGLYVLKITVSGDLKFGEATVNITVLPPKRQNKPPQAIIRPSSQTVSLPNSAILDGSDSTDDDQIVSWQWEEMSGPLQDHELNTQGPMLTLKDMAPGNYTFRLTVTDSDGDTNTTSANVTIKKEMDYPPLADAGSDQVIYLPQNTLTLYGNRSSDDKGKLSYEWIKSTDNDLPVGMTGVRTPLLNLENLEAGDYKFTLKVTDSSGQVSSADVHVFVKPETNHPPEAKTAGHVTLFLPLESLTLDGSNSTDDKGQMEYAWIQKGGPTSLTLASSDQMVAFATGHLVVGKYMFQLTVTDGQLQQSSAPLFIELKKDENFPPRAHAGGDQTLQVPVTVVTLNGSKSSDDHGIVKYTWTRDSKSLAAGTVVGQSDQTAILQLVSMVTGQYMFTLTVEDAEGLTSSDTAHIQIKKNDQQLHFVELILDANIEHFTLANKQSLQDQLELLLQKSSEDRDTSVEFVSTREDIMSGRTILTFKVLQKTKEGDITVMPGVRALQTLRNKLNAGKLLDYSIARLDLSVCQNNCSGHGHCDQKTKECICEAFWMPNYFTSSLFGTESNCDWSVLYVVIICFIIVVALVSCLWALFCCLTTRRCRTLKLKARKRHRYSLLKDREEDIGKDDIELPSRGKIQNSSVMISESELSSDEETLFISKKSPNGSLNGKTNGTRTPRNRLKT